MQRDEAVRDAQMDAPDEEEGSLLDALLIAVPSLVNRYRDQLIAIRHTLRLELRLNLKCAALLLLYAIVLSCVVLSSWAGLNALLYLFLISLNAPLWVAIAALVLTHLLALTTLARALRAVVAEMGFDQLQTVLGLSSQAASKGDTQ